MGSRCTCLCCPLVCLRLSVCLSPLSAHLCLCLSAVCMLACAGDDVIGESAEAVLVHPAPWGGSRSNPLLESKTFAAWHYPCGQALLLGGTFQYFTETNKPVDRNETGYGPHVQRYKTARGCNTSRGCKGKNSDDITTESLRTETR